MQLGWQRDATSPRATGYLTVPLPRTLTRAAGRTILLALAGLLAVLALAAAPAQASHSQVAMFEDDGLLSDPTAVLTRMHMLGVGEARVYVEWSAIAPKPLSATRPKNFNAGDPAAYPRANWARYDAVVRDAASDGITVDMVLTGGSPIWADGSGIPRNARNNPHFAWKPSAREFGYFVHAVAKRYSGSYQGLPAVRNWELWNEVNFGEDLGPQATDGSTVSVAPNMYRGLLNAAWSSLRATGHTRDTMVIGQLAARGLQLTGWRKNPQGLPGDFGQTKPLQFIRTLYCVDSHFSPLRGSAARGTGCPTSNAASRRFAAQNPALFSAGGFGVHPYPQNLPPTQEASTDPDFAAFSEIPNLERTLDRAQRVYGRYRALPIYNNEYGYVTRPPSRGNFVTPATAAYYLNWAEYLSWRNPRIVTTMQYLLYDPRPGPSQFDSGLATYRGVPKATYSAYRLPLYLPVTKGRRGQRLEVWGGVRPAHTFAGSQQARILFARGAHGAWTTLTTLTITDPRGYFDTRLAFPASGSLRISWTYPSGAAVSSRTVQVTIH